MCQTVIIRRRDTISATPEKASAAALAVLSRARGDDYLVLRFREKGHEKFVGGHPFIEEAIRMEALEEVQNVPKVRSDSIVITQALQAS
jgi:glycerol-3-phosphate cytidylyltransferase-like family protein